MCFMSAAQEPRLSRAAVWRCATLVFCPMGIFLMPLPLRVGHYGFGWGARK